MNHALAGQTQTSIIPRILLGTDSTLSTAMVGLDLVSILFARIERLVADGDDVADLARLGSRTASDALTECREHASSGDVIGVVDCLARTLSGHRVAKNLLLAIVEVGDADVGELAQLGVNLAASILDDLGA